MSKRLVLTCLAASLIFTGCVSTKTYRSAVEESEARKASLAKAFSEIEGEKKEIERLEKEIADLTEARARETAALRSELDELRDKGIMTSREIQALSEADKAKAAEIEGLKAERDSLVSAAKALGARLEETAAKQAETAAEAELLRKEKESLTLAAQSLKSELSQKSSEGDYLKREVDRLKLKTGELSTEKEQELANVKETYESLIQEMKKEIEMGDIKITQAVDRLSVNLVEKILFASGESELKPEGLKIIKRVGDILKTVSDKQVRVEGHTDNVQIGAKIKKKYATNWELSTARATNVVRYLIEKVGVDRRLISAAGFAENKPVATNDTQEGKALNRRIDIVLLPLDADSVLEELKK